MKNLCIIVIWSFLSIMVQCEEDGEMMVKMPGVKPELPQGESYLCTSSAVKQTLYVKSIHPINVNMDKVHHLLVIGCKDDSMVDSVWNCGGTLAEDNLKSAPPCKHSANQVDK